LVESFFLFYCSLPPAAAAAAAAGGGHTLNFLICPSHRFAVVRSFVVNRLTTPNVVTLPLLLLQVLRN